MMNTILINGPARSGKNHFARELKKSLAVSGYTSEIMEFSDPLKEIIADTLGISISELDTFKNNPDDFNLVVRSDGTYKHLTNFRQLLQRFGTEAMMGKFGKRVWVNMLKERREASNSDFILVPSFRFPHEVISPLTIKIKNDDVVCKDVHLSENALDGFEFWATVDNTGYRDLSGVADHIARRLITLHS